MRKAKGNTVAKIQAGMMPKGSKAFVPVQSGMIPRSITSNPGMALPKMTATPKSTKKMPPKKFK